MKKNYNFIVINFFRVTEPYSGASEVSFNFFKNIKTNNKILFQFSDLKKKHKKVKSIIIKNTKFQKFFHLRKIAKAVLNYAKNKKNVVIVFEGASWIGYTYVVYKILKKKLNDAKYIYHSHNVEYLLRKQKNNFLVTYFTKIFEKYIGYNFDLFTAVSKEDQKKFKDIYNIKTVILKNGIDVPTNLKKIKPIIKKYKYIFFCGSIKYKPNYEALEILVKKIMPKVIKKNSSIKLIVSGNKKIPFKENFLINVGFLSKQNFFKNLKGASLFVNPMKTGFGTQLKVINALVFGKTIITTRVGSNGIKINPKFKNFYIANNDKKFSELILKNINAKKINKQSSKYYLKNYLMKNIVNNFLFYFKLLK